MKKTAKLLVILLVFGVCFGIFAACQKDDHEHKWINGVCTECGAEYEIVDYVSQLKLDENSTTKKTAPGGNELIRMYIDGDTTHFNVPVTETHPEGVLKARYLAVNTPESTGRHQQRRQGACRVRLRQVGQRQLRQNYRLGVVQTRRQFRLAQPQSGIAPSRLGLRLLRQRKPLW